MAIRPVLSGDEQVSLDSGLVVTTARFADVEVSGRGYQIKINLDAEHYGFLKFAGSEGQFAILSLYVDLAAPSLWWNYVSGRFMINYKMSIGGQRVRLPPEKVKLLEELFLQHPSRVEVVPLLALLGEQMDVAPTPDDQKVLSPPLRQRLLAP